MFLTVVPGTFHDWNAPREIIHLTSKDLSNWKFQSKLNLSSDRTIDPCVLKLDDGSWRLWYKDEQDHSYIHYVNSPDLNQWTAGGVAINDRPSEGPIVFRWKGSIWMIVDAKKITCSLVPGRFPRIAPKGTMPTLRSAMAAPSFFTLCTRVGKIWFPACRSRRVELSSR
jgi:hypothetical protein